MDASWAQLGVTGVGRTLFELLPRLAARTPLVAVVDARWPTPDLGVETVAVGAPPGVPRLGWIELGLGRWLARRPGTLVHGPAYALPIQPRGPAVVTLHDVAWETHPRDFGWGKRQMWRLSARRSVQVAGAVLTVSKFSKQAIVATYQIDPVNVLVAPNAVGAGFGPAPMTAAVPVGLGLPARYVVALGGAPRRNLPMAVAAWRLAAAAASSPPVGLVVVGPERPPDEPGLTWLGPVDNATWAAVLAGAEALVYPTSYEGYGMPAAEASACGVPVVCAPVASLPEVLGEAAAWVPRLDAPAMGATLSDLLADPVRRASLAGAGLAFRAAAPTWEDAADVTIQAYELARHRWSKR